MKIMVPGGSGGATILETKKSLKIFSIIAVRARVVLIYMKAL
jgi:hypothetical protein